MGNWGIDLYGNIFVNSSEVSLKVLYLQEGVKRLSLLICGEFYQYRVGLEMMAVLG